MPEPMIEALLEVLEKILGFEAGTVFFFVAGGAALLVWVLAARLLGAVTGGGKGLVRTAAAVVLPLAAAAAGYAAVEVYVLPRTEVAWAPNYLPAGIGGIAGLLALLVFSTRLLGRGVFMTTLLFVLSGFGGYFGFEAARGLIAVWERNVEEVDKREKRLDRELE